MKVKTFQHRRNVRHTRTKKAFHLYSLIEMSTASTVRTG